MAQYEHLPIYKKAYDFALYYEKIVRGFSRYHKYTLGTELRQVILSFPRSAWECIPGRSCVPCFF